MNENAMNYKKVIEKYGDAGVLKDTLFKCVSKMDMILGKITGNDSKLSFSYDSDVAFEGILSAITEDILNLSVEDIGHYAFEVSNCIAAYVKGCDGSIVDPFCMMLMYLDKICSSDSYGGAITTIRITDGLCYTFENYLKIDEKHFGYTGIVLKSFYYLSSLGVVGNINIKTAKYIKRFIEVGDSMYSNTVFGGGVPWKGKNGVRAVFMSLFLNSVKAR